MLWVQRTLVAAGFMPTQAPNHWNQLPLGGTCKLGFIAQADFPQASPLSTFYHSKYLQVQNQILV